MFESGNGNNSFSKTILSAPLPLRDLACLYDQSQLAIWDLMSRDSYPRYLRSPIHQRFQSMLRTDAFLTNGDLNAPVEL
jgi:hypothetical protein